MRHGFDEWLGIPYSNDNSKYHPSLAPEMPPLPFYDGEEIVEFDPDQSQFTRRFTERAIRFIETDADRPIFVYSSTQSGVEGIASRHGYRVEHLELSLYHLEDDPGETRNLASANPDIVQRLSVVAEVARRDLGDSLQKVTGNGLRKSGLDE